MAGRKRGAGCRGGGAPGGVYRPRNPRASPLWRFAQRHGKELRKSGRLQRPVEEVVIERFLECGDAHHGFARVYCDPILLSRFRQLSEDGQTIADHQGIRASPRNAGNRCR